MIVLTTMDLIIRIAVAIGLGTVIGLERTLAGKTAGMRTYAMVSLGSSVFVLISEIIIYPLNNPLIASPLVIPAAIITGIGFIGAGLVFFQSQEHKQIGITTAAGLWVSAGVGISSGFGLFDLALISTIAALLVFTLMWFVEHFLKKYSYKPENNNVIEK